MVKVELEKLLSDLSYSLLIKNTNMFQYNSDSFKKLVKVFYFIQFLNNNDTDKKQNDFIISHLNLIKSSYINYPKYRNVQ